MVVVGVLGGLMGILADLIGANRKLLEATLVQLHQMEDRLKARDEQSGSYEAKDPARKSVERAS